jgi:hypothetical protein
MKKEFEQTKGVVHAVFVSTKPIVACAELSEEVVNKYLNEFGNYLSANDI